MGELETLIEIVDKQADSIKNLLKLIHNLDSRILELENKARKQRLVDNFQYRKE